MDAQIGYACRMAKGDAVDSRREAGADNAADAASDNGSEAHGSGRPTWATLHLWQIQMVRDVLVALAIFALLWLGYKLSIVTVPILLAMALAYLFEPVVKRLTRPRASGKSMSREAAASIIIGAAVLLVLVPVSLGIVFAVGQGIQVGGRIAQVVRLSVPIVDALNEVGSPFNEEEEWVGFQAALAANRSAEAVAQPADGEEAAQQPEPERGEGQAGQTPRADGGEAIDQSPETPSGSTIEPEEDPAKLAARADAAWESMGRRFPGLQDTFAWMMVRFADGAGAGEESSLGRMLSWFAAAVEANLQGIAQRGVSAAQAVISRVISFGMFLFMLFLTAFFFYFFSTGYGRVLGFWRGLVPEARKHRVFDLVRQMDAVIAGFIRGRLTIAAIQAIFFTIAYWLVGVPAPLIIGPVVAVLSIVPYVALVGIPIAVIGMLIDPPTGWQAAWWWVLAAPTVVYFAGQALDDYVLTPLIQGKSTNMDTPSILFASIAGGALAGLYGLLLAIPVAACLKILLREVFWPRFRQWAEGRQRDFLPISGAEKE